MPTVSFAPYAVPQFLDNAGQPISGGKLETYLAGTSTPAATYADSAGAVANPTSIPLDSAGRPSNSGALVDIRLDMAKSYKLVLRDSGGNIVRTVDNVLGGLPSKSVGSEAIADGAVTTQALADEAIDASKLTGDTQKLSEISGKLQFQQSGEGAPYLALLDKMRQRATLADFGAAGNGTTDDTEAFLRAVHEMKRRGRGTIYGNDGARYRTTGTVAIDQANIVLDLKRAEVLADFAPTAPQAAFEIGDGTVMDGVGIRNGRVTALNSSLNLDGVRYRKNVRRAVAYENLRVASFKRTGILFDELNWSIQGGFAPLIEACGTNLRIDDNGNSITIVGIGLDGADGLNAEILSCVSITFVGGYVQFAKTNGVLLGTSSIGSMQPCSSINFFGTYFEGNGNRHIVGTGGRGLSVIGSFFNCNGMTGPAINLVNWTGARIAGCTPSNLSVGAQRNFVELGAGCSGIYVSPDQAVTTLSDMLVGGEMSGYCQTPYPISTIPSASPINRGSMVMVQGSGTGSNRSVPYVCADVASGTRAYRRMGLAPRKSPVTTLGSGYTPNLGQYEIHDLTVGASGGTIANPTGPYEDGDQITFLLVNGAGTAGTVSWGTAYLTDLAATGAAGTKASVTFTYSSGRTAWIQTGKMEWK